MRCHCCAGPSKDRVELRDARAFLRRSRRTDLATSVRRTIVQASRSTGFFKDVAETFLFKWLAVLAADEGEITNRADIKRSL